jgi:hypothetical protein
LVAIGAQFILVKQAMVKFAIRLRAFQVPAESNRASTKSDRSQRQVIANQHCRGSHDGDKHQKHDD